MITRKRKYDEDPAETLSKYRKLNKAKNQQKSLTNTIGNRRAAFQKKTMHGDIFVCVCCERWLYSTNVREVPVRKQSNDDEDIWEVNPDGNGNIVGINLETWQKCVPKLRQEFRSRICQKGEREEKWFVCFACQRYMKSEKMPPMCAQNGLKVVPVPEEFKDMTQLEEKMDKNPKVLYRIT